MKTLYFQCNMGAAGDMLCASLLDLLDNPAEMIRTAGNLVPGVEVALSCTQKCGITGNHVSVVIGGTEEVSQDVSLADGAVEETVHEHVHVHHHDHGHEHHHDHEHEHEHSHHHTGYEEICGMIDGMAVSDRVKSDAKAVYRRIAEAESFVHGSDIDHIHFHEVGSLDAVIDVTLFCMLMERIAPDQVIVSPIHVGSGEVRCAHGILPVPAPATAYLLKGVPSYSGTIRGELCTPTGAALLTHFATAYGSMPVMSTEKIGYGMGNKDFPVANCVRVFLGEASAEAPQMYEISFNVDDMTAEAIAFAQERLFEAGAVEVFLTPVTMKKGRPGLLFTVICRADERESVVKCAFTHTSTIGMREKPCSRYTMQREILRRNTVFGEVRSKHSSGYGVSKDKYEYEDIARIAKENGLSISEVLRIIGKE